MKQTLKQAVYLSHRDTSSLYRAASYLMGCPEGGWGETVQAVSRICEALPIRSERSYSVHQFIESVYRLDHADRFERRSLGEALAEAERIANA